MHEAIANYFKEFATLLNSVRVTTKAATLDFYQGIEMACNLIVEQSYKGNKVIFIGNGGSAAIASHMAVDFWKNRGIKAVAFNDGSLLTCISNDYGYKHVFEKPIAMFAQEGDVLIALSSSGRSENILVGTRSAMDMGCLVITLSGFEPNNPLSCIGSLNFYVPSNAYGPVETLHQIICHSFLDMLIETNNG